MNWFIPGGTVTTSTTWPAYPTFSVATAPIKYLSPRETHRHDPRRDLTCAQFEDLVDSEQAMLLAHLERPCPNCGHPSTWLDDEGEAE